MSADTSLLLGAYIRIAPGHMRNDFFPAKLARYVVGQELKQFLASGRTIQRDAEFAIRKGLSEAELEAENRAKAQQEAARLKESDMTVCENQCPTSWID
jgi:uncharacterized protein YciI